MKMVSDSSDFRRQRSIGQRLALVALAVGAALWLSIYFLMPPLSGMADPLARLIFALKCSCIAILFCFLTGIEAVAHERLVSPAFDPLKGYETRRMKVNLRYLQNTLEQTILFVPGLLVLALYCPDGASMRAVVATTAVWILSRGGFWIGYHYGAAYRTAGVPGVLLTLLLLLYVCARFGYEVAGITGAVAVVVVYIIIEIYLFRATGSTAPAERPDSSS
jgi:hypothetical protein